MRPFRHLALVAAALGLLALPACSGKSATQKADDARIVRIVAGAATVDGKLEPSGLTGVVQDQGWLAGELAKKGYKLQFVDMPHAIGGPMINEGFVNKTVEFAFYGDLPAVIGASGGRRFGWSCRPTAPPTPICWFPPGPRPRPSPT